MNDFVQNMMAYLEQHHQRSNSKVSFALSEPKKWHRKKWIKYEREHSNSLWHVDWHEIKDPKVKRLIVHEDDSSRFIIGYGNDCCGNSYGGNTAVVI